MLEIVILLALGVALGVELHAVVSRLIAYVVVKINNFRNPPAV